MKISGGITRYALFVIPESKAIYWWRINNERVMIFYGIELIS